MNQICVTQTIRYFESRALTRIVSVLTIHLQAHVVQAVRYKYLLFKNANMIDGTRGCSLLILSFVEREHGFFSNIG